MMGGSVYISHAQPQSALISGRGGPAKISAALAVTLASLVSGTSSAAATQFSSSRIQQTSPVTQYVVRDEEVSIVRALSGIKEAAGLTWEQLGLLFGVSRKTIHNWLAGAGIKPIHKAAISEALETVHGMAGEKQFKLRRILLGDKLPVKKVSSDFGPVLESLAIGPQNGYQSSEDNTLEVLE